MTNLVFAKNAERETEKFKTYMVNENGGKITKRGMIIKEEENA